jgi:hypothetical protein
VTPFEEAAWKGAQADYDKWRAVGPVELPGFDQADPYIAKVFLNRSALILSTALEGAVVTWPDESRPEHITANP